MLTKTLKVLNLLGRKMTDKAPHTSWRQEYLEMKAGLSKLQIRLLKEGPTQLAQAWLLQAMHNDYNKMKGITPKKSRETGYQTSMKEWFASNKDQGV